MTEHILITQCLQNDFVKPIGKFEEVPNKLHIGYKESVRLMGETPSEGPVSRMMSWAYQQAEENLQIIHIRDWHDLQDHHQEKHLLLFGPHCLKNTTGADFAFNHSLLPQRKTEIINALTLNDFNETSLATKLDNFTGKKVNIGLIGVWTEAKIFFLAYELRTRYPDFELAICSALTASSTIARHHYALKQINNLLDIRIIPSIGSFVEFLGGSSADLSLNFPENKEKPEILWQGKQELSNTDQKLVKILFRDCETVNLKELYGGFSGNRVLRSESKDENGHIQVPHVIKIGQQENIGEEREAFEQIEGVLGNNAPSIVDHADYNERGALKYRYASMGKGNSRTFEDLYCNTPLSIEKIKFYLDKVFIEQLGRFYVAATPASKSLFEEYTFFDYRHPAGIETQIKSKTQYIKKQMQAILGNHFTAEFIDWNHQEKIFNLAYFYENCLPEIYSLKRLDHYQEAFVHGDLNGANILIDPQKNVWLIDFSHTGKGHVLKDLIKLENDLLYLFTPVNNPDELREACHLSRIIQDFSDDLLKKPGAPFSFKSPQFTRAYEVVRLLRSYYPLWIDIYRNPLQFMVGQLRYAAHTLSFDQANIFQKKWALYTASQAAQFIRQKLVKNKSLRIDYLPSEIISKGKLGITLLPGRKDYNRDLKKDLEVLKQEKISHIICLITKAEFKNYGVESLLKIYQENGFKVSHFPIMDQGTPEPAATLELLEQLQKNLEHNARVLLHCAGGLGRAGTITACYLKKLGFSSEDAINTVRKYRSSRAIETKSQEKFIRNFLSENNREGT